ncbi:MAG: LamG domain-containing protein, partial [Candidatus Aenigmarchaeota archaeon]|nr:LamG domain-containing protein [Candidatus Aenigmarchaeota archaeon]
NKGTAELKNLAFFVDNNPVPATGAPVAKDGVGTFTLNATQLAQYPGKKLKVTSAGFSQQEDANFYAKNTVAYYTFDGTDGRTIKDESGNNNHGTFVGETFNDGTLSPACPNCPQLTTGKYGNALSFDGVNDYVDIGNVIPTLTEGTVEAWVKRIALTGTYQMVISDSGSQLELTWSVNTLQFYVNNVGVQVGNSDLTNWQHLVGTFSQTGNFQRLYVNGVLAASGLYPGDATAASRTIGSRGGSLPFTGSIDEVRVYSRALSAAEVAEDMNSPYPIDRPANLPNGNGMSIFMWIKPATVAATQSLFSRTHTKGDLRIWGDAEVAFRVQNSTNCGGACYCDTYKGTSAARISADQWYHVVAVYNGTFCGLYINGELKTSTTGAYNDMISSSAFGLGTDAGTNNNGYNGVKDEVRILNVARE